ncbi:MAG: RDD family protein [Planctomycetaceae bacterium]|nr:RDD family protein [Planctomycetaceae bacterium]
MAARQQPIDSIVQVVTPENIAFEYRIAGPFRRLPALLIDNALVAAIELGIFLVLGITLGWLSPGLAVSVALLGKFILDWFYGGFFETFMNGQTPGKMVCSLRVLTDQGQPINGLQAVLRNLIRTADILLGVGLIVMAMNRRYQRLGDLVCGTIVVVEDRQWLTGVAKLDDPRAIQLAAYLPPNFVVSKSMAKALATYVERRRFFSIPRRREVAKHLAEPLLERFGLPLDTSYDLLLCALFYRTFIADRSQDERMLAEAQASFAQANPFVAFMNNGQPYQLSQYPGGPPAQSPFRPGPPPPLPQEQLVGAGNFGQGK